MREWSSKRPRAGVRQLSCFIGPRSKRIEYWVYVIDGDCLFGLAAATNVKSAREYLGLVDKYGDDIMWVRSRGSKLFDVYGNEIEAAHVKPDIDLSESSCEVRYGPNCEVVEFFPLEQTAFGRRYR